MSAATYLAELARSRSIIIPRSERPALLVVGILADRKLDEPSGLLAITAEEVAEVTGASLTSTKSALRMLAYRGALAEVSRRRKTRELEVPSGVDLHLRIGRPELVGYRPTEEAFS